MAIFIELARKENIRQAVLRAKVRACAKRHANPFADAEIDRVQPERDISPHNAGSPNKIKAELWP